ncbi:protein kinase domain-containing protein [Nocardia sp. CA-145437]|uniref:serine/threonine-protein kinase n=1 Tax=Nocardia sp. CA-145437 TaxID=3239980 RepID=UPI003D95DFA2
MDATELAAGSVFAGYVIERRLGAGGMGTVYLARHRALDMPVALKLLTPMKTGTAGTAQFRREAQLVANLQHPNIVDVKDFGDADGTLWMAMQYVPGGDLADLIEANPFGIDPDRAVRMVADVAAALDYAHAHQVVHRDVKPANIFRTTGTAGADWVLIGDFGIARSLAAEETQTATGRWAFSQPYAPPEQCAGRTVGPPADVHALAVTLYQLTTGHLPREIPIPATDPSLPGLLGVVLAKATAWQPADRYPGCGALAAAAEAALRLRDSDPLSRPAIPAPLVRSAVLDTAPTESSPVRPESPPAQSLDADMARLLAADSAQTVDASTAGPPEADPIGRRGPNAAGPHGENGAGPSVVGTDAPVDADPLRHADPSAARARGSVARSTDDAEADPTRTRVSDSADEGVDPLWDDEPEHPGGFGSSGRGGPDEPRRSAWWRIAVTAAVGAVAGAAVIAGVLHGNSGSDGSTSAATTPPPITARCLNSAPVPVAPGLHVIVPATADGGRRCILSTKDAAQGPLTGVQTLQAALRACYSAVINDTEGVFGPDTKRAVLAAQDRHAVTKDGVFGPQTSAAMTWPVTAGDGTPQPPCRTVGI